MNYNKLNNIVGWAVFLVAAIVFLGTIEPTASLWDCGEYIATAYKLEVGHPPGAPTFMMLGRVFSAFSSPENAAMMVNAMSGLSSAFGVLFIFWCITMLTKKVALREGAALTKEKTIAILGSGVVGACAFIFTDSFWFSAVEGEVYAMSAMFTAATFWAILKWETVADEPRSDRWLILIAYLIGLSIGVHLLNLLAIPAVAYVYYFKRYEKATRKGFIITGVVGLFLLVLVQAFIIPKIVELAAWFEITSVNSFGLPFNSGALLFGVIMVSLIILALRWTHKKGKVMWNTAVLCFMVLLIGYSSFAMIMIRSNANTPMDENNPENLVSLLAYLNREQYGTWPISHGPYWNTPIDYTDPYSDGSPVYTPLYTVQQNGADIADFSSEGEALRYVESAGSGLDIVAQYKITDDRESTVPNYDPEYSTIFPRMFYKQDKNKIQGYKNWSGYQTAWENNDMDGHTVIMDKRPGAPPNTPLTDAKGNIQYLPTFGENLTFFWKYQVKFMYWRYFLWNFSGRQNDSQGDGNLLEGNWLSGLDFIDNQRLGPQELVPESISNNRGYNKFYMLPLLLGLIGLIFQLARAPKDFTVVMLLFLLTGFAIIIYLNQKPYEPRERDYAYAASFMVFTIWIGMGVYALFDAAINLTMSELKRIGMYVGGAIAVSFIFESIGGSDHTLSYSLIYLGLFGTIATAAMYFLGQKMKQGMALLAIPLLLGISAPTVMALDGWDDHDRSGRYTATDLAKNYLDSCAPNAILFTNGDNDTFPLWYVQEVEGYRTDVRVCNLSLLSTDWYISQMQMQAYDSDPVPFGMTEAMYRQGTRDFVEIVQDEQDRSMNITDALNFVYDDRNTTASRFTGEQEYYFPTRNFVLPVDKDKVLANGTVNPEDADLIVDEVRWTVSGGYVVKNTLMVLDLLANFNWDRPIYFASTTGTEAYAGLQNYFQLEGLAYRFVPIQTVENGNPLLHGRINIEKMYDNLMNKFLWNGLNDPDVHLSYYDLRMTGNYRIQFNNLADALITDAQAMEAEALSLRSGPILQDSLFGDSLAAISGDDIARADELDAKAQEYYTMAGNLLDKLMEILPEKNAPFTGNMVFTVELYHQLGETEKAHAINARLADLFMQDLNYYSAMTNEQRGNLNSFYDRCITTLGSVLEFLVDENDYEKAQEVIACIDRNVVDIAGTVPRTAILMLGSEYTMGNSEAADMRGQSLATYYSGMLGAIYADQGFKTTEQADNMVMEYFRWFSITKSTIDEFSENAELKTTLTSMYADLQIKEQERQQMKQGGPISGGLPQ